MTPPSVPGSDNWHHNALGFSERGQKGPPIAAGKARAFVGALTQEYVRGVRGAVSGFNETLPVFERDMLKSFESRVRKASDRQAAIESLARSWSIEDASGPGARSAEEELLRVFPHLDAGDVDRALRRFDGDAEMAAAWLLEQG